MKWQVLGFYLAQNQELFLNSLKSGLCCRVFDVPVMVQRHICLVQCDLPWHKIEHDATNVIAFRLMSPGPYTSHGMHHLSAASMISPYLSGKEERRGMGHPMVFGWVSPLSLCLRWKAPWCLPFSRALLESVCHDLWFQKVLNWDLEFITLSF